MSDEKKVPSVFKQNLEVLSTLDGMQKYILGKKKNGQDRAWFDVAKEIAKMCDKKKKKHKKHKKHNDKSSYAFYIDTKKHGKKKKHKKHWNIEDDLY